MRTVVVMITLLITLPADAATYYVEQGVGSDGNSGTEAQPFATPQGCINNMSGGDTCLIKNGTYIGSGPENYRPFFNFCRLDADNACTLSGTESSPTTIRAYPGHTPVLCSQPDCSNPPTDNRAVIGVGTTAISQQTQDYNPGHRGKHYLFEGLTIDGGIHFWYSDHIEVRNCTLKGSTGDEIDGNKAMIFTQNASYLHIHHNHFFDHEAAPANRTQSMVLYCMTDSVIEYNTFDRTTQVNIQTHVLDKESGRRNVFRYNHCVGDVCWTGANQGSSGDTVCECTTTCPTDQGPHPEILHYGSSEIEVYGNVVDVTDGNSTAFQTYLGEDVDFHHNTVVGSAEGFRLGSVDETTLNDVTMRDNLVQQPANASANVSMTCNIWEGLSAVVDGNKPINWNVYDSSGVYDYINVGGVTGGCAQSTTEHSLTEWSSFLPYDLESDSQELSVQFMAGTDTNYHLAPGSPATMAASNGGEVGAYGVTECVGHTCGGTATYACNDNLDNDGDGKTDYDGVDQIDGNADDDLGCTGPSDPNEDNCGDGINGDTEDCDASDGIAPIDAPATCSHWAPGSVYGSVSCSSCEVVTESCTSPCNTELDESGWAANLIPESVITSGDEDEMIDDDTLTGPTTALDTTFPVHADIDMGSEQSICGMVYTFGVDDEPVGLAEGDSKIEEYKIYTSPNGTDWTQRDAGVFPNVAPSADRVTFSSNVTARHLRLEALSSWKDNIHMDNKRISVHEIDIIMPSTPGPPGGGGPCFVNSVSSLMNSSSPLHISITGCGAAPGTIELGDQPNYSVAVLRSQPVASWQATGRIESTIDLGSFTCSTSLWVFVTPDGGVPSKGYPVTACAKAGREPSDVKVEIIVTD